jgi:hypothetical protein
LGYDENRRTSEEGVDVIARLQADTGFRTGKEGQIFGQYFIRRHNFLGPQRAAEVHCAGVVFIFGAGQRGPIKSIGEKGRH